MRTMMLLLIAVAGAGRANQESLRQLVRQHGDVAVAVLNEYSPASVSDLVKESDLVAQVLVIRKSATLSPDETRISTNYTAQIMDIIQVRGQSPRIGGNIMITRPGGTMILEGHTVSAIESDFPDFEPGVNYVLFLRSVKDGSYRIAHGAQGAFRVNDTLVEQLSRNNAAIRAHVPQLSIRQLRAEITRAAQEKF